MSAFSAEERMNRRIFIASGATAILGAALLRKSVAAPASLSVRPTAGGPLVTPNGKFFLYSQMRYPAKLPDSIQIDGLVDTPTRFAVDDLAKLPPVKKTLTLECFVNTAGGALIFNTPFEGAPLSALLQKAGVKPEAKAARVEAVDGHPPFLLPLTELQRPETMLVGKFGGAPVPMQHGSPYTRLFIPGAGGNHHPKWVSRITFVADAAPEHPAPPMAGFIGPTAPTVTGSMAGVTLTGYHYTGAENVGAVEVSTDGGASYRPMPLPPQPDADVWVTWELTFKPPEPGFYVLRVRATSASGRKQDFPGTLAVEIV
jgi:DMSO/TMAO reductase YedYZ molybdopterin-dependent catalytic subunit